MIKAISSHTRFFIKGTGKIKMLVLTRKIGEAILIGDDIKITIVQVKGRQVRLGIEAPRETQIHREEVLDKIKKAIEVESAAVEQAQENGVKTGTDDQ